MKLLVPARVPLVVQARRLRHKACVLSILLVVLGWAGQLRADRVEFLAGSKVEGRVIARDAKSVTVTTSIGERTYTRKYPLDKVHAITVEGEREVIHEKAAAQATPGKTASSGKTAAPKGRRNAAETEALIARVGSTPPDWWDSVPLNYPKTLDLSWPEKAPEGWNNQRNIGQYVWDVINTNPDRYREGVRFMHYLLSVHKDHPEVQRRAMIELGRMYQLLLQDYARAAFWWRKAGADRGGEASPGGGVHLAECYWRLGNKQMALELLNKVPLQFSTIKLWADMGETRRALQVLEANMHGEYADFAYIYAGDACRVSGQYVKALDYYDKLLALPATGQAAKRIERNQQRARANAEAIRLFDTLDLKRVPDGTYRSSSLGYETQVQVEVCVQGGRIESVRVTQHREKQFYSAFTDTERKIIEKQGVQGIDATSSATITSEAIINATAKALAGAMKQ